MKVNVTIELKTKEMLVLTRMMHATVNNKRATEEEQLFAQRFLLEVGAEEAARPRPGN